MSIFKSQKFENNPLIHIYLGVKRTDSFWEHIFIYQVGCWPTHESMNKAKEIFNIYVWRPVGPDCRSLTGMGQTETSLLTGADEASRTLRRSWDEIDNLPERVQSNGSKHDQRTWEKNARPEKWEVFSEDLENITTNETELRNIVNENKQTKNRN